MEFITYRRFTEEGLAKELVSLLEKNGIAYHLSDEQKTLEYLYGSNQYAKSFFVSIKKEDFPVADAILLNNSSEYINSIDKNHYLFGFSDEELLEILAKPDEWSELDYQLAQKILRDKGKDISENTLQQLKNNRLKELTAPDKNQKKWIIAGYIIALLFGLLGIFIGWHLYTFKKTLPSGERMYAYSKADRKHGERILVIGMVIFAISIVSFIMSMEA
jgi:hypothetical protein